MHPALSALTYAERIAIRLDSYRKILADRPSYMESNRDNILFLLRYYENGGEEPAPGETRWIMDGKILDYKPTFPTPSPALGDTVCLFQSRAIHSANFIPADRPSCAAWTYWNPSVLGWHCSDGPVVVLRMECWPYYA
jgi:hypothetical protein